MKRVQLSEQIRRAIEASGQTRYRISMTTGIPQSTLSKFMTGKMGLSMEVLDTLADLLDLNLATDKPAKRKGR